MALPIASTSSSATIPRTEELITAVRICDTSKMPIEICYQCFGDPQAGNPVVLLVGGLNMQLCAWDEDFCEDLVRAGFFVVRYDNRDIGLSTKIEARGSIVGARLLLPKKWASVLGERLPYTLVDMAKDGLALLDALHVHYAHVIGISMGGMIAQHMALLASDRILSLTSIMSTTNAVDLPDTAMWVKLWMLRKPPKNCSLEMLLEFRVETLRRLLRHALPVDSLYLKRRYLMSLKRSSYGNGLVRQAAAILRCPGRDEELRKLRIPALVIHGAQDVVVPPVHGHRTACVLPHARMLVLKSMGHYFHPAFFYTIVRVFADMASTTIGPGLPLGLLTRAMRGVGNIDTPGSGDACSPVATPVAEQECVEPSALMASMANYFVPVVASADSTTGRAARKSVMVAMPSGTGNPALPEAVLIELRPEEVTTGSMPGKGAEGRFIKEAEVSPTKNGTTLNNSGLPKNNEAFAPKATEVLTCNEMTTTASSAASPTTPVMSLFSLVGVEPFVAGSPSVWNQVSSSTGGGGGAWTSQDDLSSIAGDGEAMPPAARGNETGGFVSAERSSARVVPCCVGVPVSTCFPLKDNIDNACLQSEPNRNEIKANLCSSDSSLPLVALTANPRTEVDFKEKLALPDLHNAVDCTGASEFMVNTHVASADEVTVTLLAPELPNDMPPLTEMLALS